MHEDADRRASETRNHYKARQDASEMRMLCGQLSDVVTQIELLADGPGTEILTGAVKQRLRAEVHRLEMLC